MADDEVVVASAEESLTTPLLEPAASPGDPSVEVSLYRRGAGPAKVFRSGLRGPRRDRLDVRGIQAEHGLRSLFAFKPGVSRRGLRIRPDPATGHSAVPFRDGAAIALDGEPKVKEPIPARFAFRTPRRVDIAEGVDGLGFLGRAGAGVVDQACVDDRRRPAGAGGVGCGGSQLGAGVATVVERSQRPLLAVDPRQRGHRLRPSQDAATSSSMEPSYCNVIIALLCTIKKKLLLSLFSSEIMCNGDKIAE